MANITIVIGIELAINLVNMSSLPKIVDMKKACANNANSIMKSFASEFLSEKITPKNAGIKDKSKTLLLTGRSNKR